MMFEFDNPLDTFLSRCAASISDDVPNYLHLNIMSRWSAGDAELETQRSEELLIDSDQEVFVLVGSGGINTFWGGEDLGMKMMIFPKAGAREYLRLRAAYDKQAFQDLDNPEYNDDELSF